MATVVDVNLQMSCGGGRLYTRWCWLLPGSWWSSSGRSCARRYDLAGL